MKSIKTTIVTLIISLLSIQAYAQSDNTVKIKTSAVCEMCQYTIEKDMAFEKGVKSATLDLEDMVLTVAFNPKKTSPKTIKERITKIGYDADDLKRDPEAHNKLPLCCQSDANGVPTVDHDDE